MSFMDQPPTITPYSAKNMAQADQFLLRRAWSEICCLSGDFNDWNPISHPMKRRADGWWFLQVPLTHGHHPYYFVVDSEPTLDPQSAGLVRNGRDEVVSLIAVS
jgi:1,4-alpha-glucan branching enzyme